MAPVISQLTYVTLTVPQRPHSGSPEGRDYGPRLDVDAQTVSAYTTNAPLVAAPLAHNTAMGLRDQEGCATVIVEADVADLIKAGQGRFAGGDRDECDYLHDLAFSFGIAEDASYRVIGVKGDGFLLVAYTCKVAERETRYV